MNDPDVSIVIPSYNGKQHLPPLLDSLCQLDYPKERLEILVVDDASTDGTREEVAPQYPQVRFLRNEQNRHYAYTINHGARHAGGEYLFLLNNDTRVQPGVVRALVETVLSDPACRAVAARMVDWDGRRILYNGAYINLEAKGFEEGSEIGGPDAENWRREQLLACGGAAFIHRETFLALGALDDAYGIYYEDVDFGWRLNLAGWRIAFCPAAVVHHRLHAYMDSVRYEQKAHFYERNALWTLFKNLSDENLGRVLPAVLLLSLWRSQALSRQARAETEAQLPALKAAVLGWADRHFPHRLVITGRAGISHLAGAVRFLDDLPALREKRAQVQALRTVPDETIFRPALFPRPFRIWAFNEDHYRYLRAAGYGRVWRETIELFDLSRLFPGRSIEAFDE